MNIRDFQRAVIAQQFIISGDSEWRGLSTTSNSWSINVNWFQNNVPVNGDNLIFAGTTRLAPDNDIDALTLNNITWAVDAGAFTITGNSFTQQISSSITNNSSNIQTITNDITLAGTTPSIDIKTNTADIVLSGVISGSNGLIKNGASALTLSNGSNSYSGVTTINGGTVKLGNIAPLGTGNLTLAGTGILDLNGYAYTFPTTTISTLGNRVINSGADIIPTIEADRYDVTKYIKLKGSTYNLQFNDTDSPSIGKISLLCGQGATSATLANTTNTLRGRVWLQGGTTTIASSLATFGTVSLLIGNGSTTPVLVYNGTTATTIGPRDIQMGLGGSATTGGGATIKNNGDGAVTLYGAYAEDNTVTKKLTLGGSNISENTIGGTGSTIRNATTTGVVSVEKVDGGKWVIDGVNTYTGGTVVTGGTLKIGHKNALGTSTLTLAAGTILDINGKYLQNSLEPLGDPYADTISDASSTIINTGASLSNTNRPLFLTPGDPSLANNSVINAEINDTDLPSIGSISLRLGHQGAKVTFTNTNNKIRGKIVLTGTSTTTVANMNYGSFGHGDLESGNANTSQTLIYNGAGDSNIGTRDIALTCNNSGVGGGLIIKNSGTGILTLNGAYAVDNTTTKTLTLGGANTGNNILTGVIRNAATNGVINVQKIDAGNWILSGANTYTGGTTIKAGTLVLDGGNNRLLATSAVVLGDTTTAGKLVLGSTAAANQQTLTALTTTGLGGSVVGANAANSMLTLNIAPSTTTTFAGVLGGSGANENNIMLKTPAGAGGGTLILTGNNSFSGGVELGAGSGKIIAGHNNALGTGTITINGLTQLSLNDGITINNNAIITGEGNAKDIILREGATSATFAGNIVNSEEVGSNFDLNAFAGGTLTVSGIISSGVAAAGMDKQGAGTVTLTAANTYTGSTTLTAGTLSLGNGGTTGRLTATSAISAASGANLTINRSDAFSQATDLGAGVLISGAGSFTQAGAGTTTLTAANTYTGTTIINAGTLQFAKTASFYSNVVNATTAAKLTVNSGGLAAFNIGGSGEFTEANITTLLGASNGTVGFKTGASLGLDTTNASGGNFTLASVLANPAGSTSLGLAKLGTGSLTLTTANTYTGTTAIKNGTLVLDEGNNRLPVSAPVVLGDTGTAGKLVLGGTTTASQTLTALTTTGLGGSVVGGNAANSVLTILALASVTFDGMLGGAGTNENKLGFAKSGNGAVTLSNIASTFNGAITVNAGTLAVTKLANNDTASSIGSHSFTIRLGAIGGSTGTLSYIGTTDASTNKSIQIGNVTAGTNGNGSVVNNSASGKLTFTGTNFNTAWAGITAARALTLGGSYTGAANEITGVIQDNNTAGGGIVSLTKTGDSTWQLSGANTYTGATSIIAGTLGVVSKPTSGTTTTTASAVFTPTTLAVTFAAPPAVNTTVRFFPGATTQSYGTITLINAPGRTAAYDSSNSTLTITT